MEPESTTQAWLRDRQLIIQALQPTLLNGCLSCSPDYCSSLELHAKRSKGNGQALSAHFVHLKLSKQLLS